MVVILAPAVDKICESFTYNPLKQSQAKPIFLSLMGIHKECIANESEFESDFRGGKHGFTSVTMVDQQYTLHSQIAFVCPRKPGHMQSYPINPTRGDISIADQQYQNNIHDSRLVKSTNIFRKKIVVASINGL